MLYYLLALLIGARAVQIGFFPDTLEHFAALDPLTRYVLELPYGAAALALLLGIISLGLAVRATGFFMERRKLLKLQRRSGLR